MFSYICIVQIIDVYIGGELLCIVVLGLFKILVGIILEQCVWLCEYCDDLCCFLMNELCGYVDMYGVYLLFLVMVGVDFGVIFIYNEGYSDMCGYGIIVFGKVLVEMGYVECIQLQICICFDVLVGFIEVFVEWDGVCVGKVSFNNVFVFIYCCDVEVEMFGFGKIIGDIVFGGVFYYYINVVQVGFIVKFELVCQLIQLGVEIKVVVMVKVVIVYLLELGFNMLYGIIIDSEFNFFGVDQFNVCIFVDCEVDCLFIGIGILGCVVQLFLCG